MRQNILQVDIMMPVFNGESTLSLALNSVLYQTYSHWRCIIVNDGSTDGTKAILDQLTDSRFMVIHLPENMGRPYARQVALTKVHGEYLTYLDADDIYHSEKLQKQVEVFNTYPEVDLVSCFMGSYNQNLILTRYRGVGVDRVNKVLSNKFTGVYEAPHAPSMVKTLYAKTLNYDLRLKYAQDADYFVRYLKGRNYYVLSDVLYFYSEFDSVTARKILQTRFYGLVRVSKYYNLAPYQTIKTFLSLFTKWLVTSALIPFVGAEYFILKRGNPVTQEMDNSFQKVLEDLG